MIYFKRYKVYRLRCVAFLSHMNWNYRDWNNALSKLKTYLLQWQCVEDKLISQGFIVPKQNHWSYRKLQFLALHWKIFQRHWLSKPNSILYPAFGNDKSIEILYNLRGPRGKVLNIQYPCEVFGKVSLKAYSILNRFPENPGIFVSLYP